MLKPGAIQVGALTSGKGMNLKTENVFKRKDIIFCYSAREWFRKGRIIKVTFITSEAVVDNRKKNNL